MALARVRGCAGQARRAAQAASGSTRQADASRRQSGPRKATSRRPITVRLRSKSCPAGGHMTSPELREKGSSGHGRPRTSQQADVGSKTRSAGRVPTTGNQGRRGDRDGNHLQRQADRSERVELTIRSRGPAIRAEAAADDRYAALDLAFIKLEGRLRKAAERRKVR